jgi:hypothetical protein
MAVADPIIAREEALRRMMSDLALDPLGFVQTAYAWPIHNEPGPDDFQRDFLMALGEAVRARRFDGIHPVLPIRMGISSGHGPGKTVLTAWICHWLMSTRRNCRGTVTANTNDQLERKTWAAVREWYQWLITRHWFEINAKAMFRIGEARPMWNVAPQSCAEENSEAFAGQHAKESTSFYVFDEASAIPEKIWKVAEGGLATGEPMIFAFGNPTRNVGEFHRIAFGTGRDRWTIQVLDTRHTKFSNKTLIQEWIDDYGEDSDFVRVRVRGLPPNQSETQFIGADRIYQAQINLPAMVEHEPLICGVDVSGGGASQTVCAFRRGNDARSIHWITLSGDQTTAHDRQVVVARLAQAIEDYGPMIMNVDSAFGSPIVERLKQLGYGPIVREVNFGAEAPDPHDGNQRAYQWRLMRDWLPKGCIDQKDHRLAADLGAPGYHLNRKQQLILEPKEAMQRRGVASPDRGDALSLTFAAPVRMSRPVTASRVAMPSGAGSWMAS